MKVPLKTAFSKLSPRMKQIVLAGVVLLCVTGLVFTACA